jgi:nucleotide-binding universal stress UspA family protein
LLPNGRFVQGAKLDVMAVFEAAGTRPMKWVVGVDLLPDSQGALEFVAWLHGREAVGPGEVRGLCVLEEAAFFTVRGDARVRIEEGVRKALAGLVDASHARGALGELDARIAGSVHTALCDLAREHEAVLVIGRQARRGEGSLVRLGKIARRLLRHLPVPVAVVPPDIQLQDFPEGPVLVAVDTTEASLPAIAFGRAYARVVGRAVRLVHVLPSVGAIGLEYVSAARSAELRHEYGQRSRRAFDDFVHGNGLDDLPVSLLPGPVIESVLEVAGAERACSIVCGSRKLGVAARVVSASIGSELAAAASVPVVVVPPDYDAARV